MAASVASVSTIAHGLHHSALELLSQLEVVVAARLLGFGLALLLLMGKMRAHRSGRCRCPLVALVASGH